MTDFAVRIKNLPEQYKDAFNSQDDLKAQLEIHIKSVVEKEEMVYNADQ